MSELSVDSPPTPLPPEEQLKPLPNQRFRKKNAATEWEGILQVKYYINYIINSKYQHDQLPVIFQASHAYYHENFTDEIQNVEVPL